MAKTKIYAPVAEYSGSVAGVRFEDGVAEADEQKASAAFAYFRRHGYGIGKRAEPEPAAEEEPLPEPIVATAPLRDAAVDPQPEDFLPPINAGEANPHGQRVVSPQIHASETGPIRPGPVAVTEPAQQSAEESELDEQVFVEGADVMEATAAVAEPGEAPARSASKAAWVDYAVARGMGRDEAEDMSRADLQERYG